MTKKKTTVYSNDWVRLNDQLRRATEAQCKKLLAQERAGQDRFQYLMRIHSRLNRVRRARERKELAR